VPLDQDHSTLEGALESAVFAVDWLLAVASPTATELRDAGRLGGYFCLATSSGLPLLVASCGSPGEGKAEKYLAFCQEKARRLGSQPEHSLSLESRDEAQDRWGGAVRGGNFIASFSGFPERLDEVVSAAVLCMLDDLSIGEARRRLRGNPYLSKLPGWYFERLCGE
jgi:hypothetical protein